MNLVLIILVLLLLFGGGGGYYYGGQRWAGEWRAAACDPRPLAVVREPAVNLETHAAVDTL